MAYDEYTAERARNLLAKKTKNAYEKAMFGGLCFMVDDKMCFGIVKDELMARLSPEEGEIAVEKEGVRPMDFTGKRMRGFIYVSADAIDSEDELEYWIDKALEFNPLAKASKKRAKK
ncbi:MAG: hypothetical protein SchgKO_19540 [Schleiferiaceae bacterium]